MRFELKRTFGRQELDAELLDRDAGADVDARQHRLSAKTAPTRVVVAVDPAVVLPKAATRLESLLPRKVKTVTAALADRSLRWFT